jgi:RND family efflux transporter MFP subunit
LTLAASLCFAGVQSIAGPYRVSVTTQPKVVPVGRANVVLTITDQSGKALDGLDVRAIAVMPGMSMGEREQRANPDRGNPGRYSMQAAFSMSGAYELRVKISGSKGEGSTVIPLKTGQDTGDGAASGFSVFSLLPYALALALLIFIVIRMRSTGQKADIKAALNRSSIIGILVLIAMIALSILTVNNLRRPGSMTPLEAQVMEMNTPAPPGSTAVELASVTRGRLSETVRYTGQAVGFVEQDVIPRGTGVIIWMPYYVGDKVKKGQILARLDTSQLDPQLAERAAMTNMAVQGVGVAASEYQTALQEIAEARAEVSAKQGIVDEAEVMLVAAQQEKEAMQAEAKAMQSDVISAQAEVAAATENSRFRTDELMRMQQLFAQKAVSRTELQQAESEAADAQAKLLQATSMVRQAESKVAGANANVRKADAMISAAQKRISQAQADVRAALAGVRTKQSAAEAAKRNIGKEQAGVAQARAGYESAAAQRGYAELKSEVDGVITQRLISPGVLVNPGQTLLKVAQISPIRLQASVAESDLAKISVGAKVTVRSRDGKGSPIEARVSSVAPSVDPQARTGIVEVVWTNSNGRFLPGQFVAMEIEVGSVSDALSLPVEAIQRPPGESGGKPIVWIAEPSGDAGQFTVRRVEVETGSSDGKQIEIRNGLKEGQQAVRAGAMYLREGGTVTSTASPVASSGPVVEVLATGYKPDTIDAKVGETITITFIRRSEETCGTEIIIPSFNVNKSLPINKPVKVTLTPMKSGEFRFTCSMDMLNGKVVVR